MVPASPFSIYYFSFPMQFVAVRRSTVHLEYGNG